ncbi:alpha/beta fold hydrolase [Salipiger mucosus]|uniref:Alpha/beta hydrolase fold protein n=1 Tax=Salipiger mucosus DSM 16094 TaxID=1123237 RepID=S9Q7L5_9RHOB|nr:alpha/beta hydrolase [Salipiger mucosus]EPX75583.1 Alpha/beta hydrolase fold protein [Salipiger mucosus DSM 16094]
MTVRDRAAALAGARPAGRFFEGAEERRVPLSGGGEIFCRIMGAGPPLLLLHGYPQTSAMWHAVAPELARDFRVICADLRGYGASHKPAGGGDHAAYSKRAMAGDMVEVMQALGHERFAVLSHDRGARVAHRLAADHPARVRALAILDIAPTREMYREARTPFAHAYWHWYWLTLPAPFPEEMIAQDPDRFWLWKCDTPPAGLAPFCREALEEYLSAFATPEAIHASCEDYRAAATIDIAHDDAETGRIGTPLLVLWGADGAIEAHFDCLALWRERATTVEGQAIPGGHYLAEECPERVLAEVGPFLKLHAED